MNHRGTIDRISCQTLKNRKKKDDELPNSSRTLGLAEVSQRSRYLHRHIKKFPQRAQTTYRSRSYRLSLRNIYHLSNLVTFSMLSRSLRPHSIKSEASRLWNWMLTCHGLSLAPFQNRIFILQLSGPHRTRQLFMDYHKPLVSL
jgi:hypothetical protein